MGDAAGTLGTAFPSAKNGDFFGKRKDSQRPAAATLVGGPLSRGPALSTARKMTHEKSGEDLLDDILGGIDANADLKVSKKIKSLQKQNPGSFVGRNGGDADLQNHGTVGAVSYTHRTMPTSVRVRASAVAAQYTEHLSHEAHNET